MGKVGARLAGPITNISLTWLDHQPLGFSCSWCLAATSWKLELSGGSLRVASLHCWSSIPTQFPLRPVWVELDCYSPTWTCSLHVCFADPRLLFWTSHAFIRKSCNNTYTPLVACKVSTLHVVFCILLHEVHPYPLYETFIAPCRASPLAHTCRHRTYKEQGMHLAHPSRSTLQH